MCRSDPSISLCFPKTHVGKKTLTLRIFLRYTLSVAFTKIISDCTGFEWDEGNFLKNWEKHGVTASECEQVFFNLPLVTGEDRKHSLHESRYYAIGHTDKGRYLFIVFTIRKNLIRVISARNMNRKERKAYNTR